MRHNCVNKKKTKKKRHISIFLLWIVYFSIFYDLWLLVWCNDMFMYWVCRGLHYGLLGEQTERDALTHGDMQDQAEHRRGKYFSSFKSFFFFFFNQCKFILSGGDRQRQKLQHWLSRVKIKKKKVPPFWGEDPPHTHTHVSSCSCFISPFFRSGSQCAIVCYQSLLCNQTMSLLSLWSVYSRCKPNYDNTDLVMERDPRCMLVARLHLC